MLSYGKCFMPLLLLADKQESMIDRYIERGDIFVMSNHDNIATCYTLVTDEEDGICEIEQNPETWNFYRHLSFRELNGQKLTDRGTVFL